MASVAERSRWYNFSTTALAILAVPLTAFAIHGYDPTLSWVMIGVLALIAGLCALILVRAILLAVFPQIEHDQDEVERENARLLFETHRAPDGAYFQTRNFYPAGSLFVKPTNNPGFRLYAAHLVLLPENREVPFSQIASICIGTEMSSSRSLDTVTNVKVTLGDGAVMTYRWIEGGNAVPVEAWKPIQYRKEDHLVTFLQVLGFTVSYDDALHTVARLTYVPPPVL